MGNGEKGYRRLADIPREYLHKLNLGKTESRTLSEWLAIDFSILLHQVLTEAKLPKLFRKFEELHPGAFQLGIMERIRAVSAFLATESLGKGEPIGFANKLAKHPADMVRCWASMMVTYDDSLSLEDRLAEMEKFASDPNMSVRELAWLSLRPHLAKNLSRAFKTLRHWAKHPHEGVRRCAIESTRPRGVWCSHLDALKLDPTAGKPLLDLVRGDPSRYVQTSVANWLNDASKNHPEWVRVICDEWLTDSPVPATRWIVNHATRTLRKSSADSMS